ncbi:hypothetical protein [Thermostaphylospora chromogena]|mgnify:CR=1 FL=1|uniref:ABC-2 type transport system permease protein n=1 Tax=Thermostaphylospora chromogena TaxID=35622 RepID=A0A1H1EH73_9ACTN|nr:hypothetical protein [Thermostaphylospora chromogena]SDQ87536.1 ABC-2 type transport system permease protein [Thermostaphylospora chromogena]
MAGLRAEVSRPPAQAAPLTLTQTALLFTRLKLRLVSGNLRGDLTAKIGFVFGLIGAVGVAGLGFLLMSLLRLAPRDIAVDLGIVAFTIVFVAWTVGPVFAFGQDETLDPARLALLPLRTDRLAVGLLAASLTGPWPAATLVVMAGGVVGLASGAGGAVLGVLAVAVSLALCVAFSRMVTTALSGVLRTRRGRDALMLGVVVFILLSQLPNLLINTGGVRDYRAVLSGIAAVLRWSPPGLAAHAIADGGVAAVAEIAALAALTLVCGLLWITALRAVLVKADASTQAAAVRGAGGGIGRLLPDGPLAAVVTKELKYARREPRGRIGWLSAIAVTAILSYTVNSDPGPGHPAQIIGPICIGGLLMSLNSANAFGVDGPSLWANAVVYGSPRQLRTDLAGRHLALCLIAVPLVLVAGIAVAILAGGPGLAVPAVLSGWGVLGVALGVGAVTSVIFPYTLPERMNAFSGAAPGQGGVAFMGSFGMMLATGVLLLPIVLPVLLGVTWVAYLAVPYGAAIAWGGRRLAANLGHARLPEVVAAVSRPS